MKTYRIVFLFAALSAMASAAFAADVTTVVNAKITKNGDDIDEASANHIQVAAYVDGEMCGGWTMCDRIASPTAAIFYYSDTLTIDESKVGKPIEMHIRVVDDGDNTNWNWRADFYWVTRGEYVVRDIVLPPGESQLTVKDGTYGSPDGASFVTLNYIDAWLDFPGNFNLSPGESVDLLPFITYTPDNCSLPYPQTIQWDFENSASYITIEGNTLIAGEEGTGPYGVSFTGTINGNNVYSSAVIVDPNICVVYSKLYVNGNVLNDYDNYGLSAYIGDQKVAGPVACDNSNNVFVLKMQNVRDGNIEFRVTGRTSPEPGSTGEGSFSESEYIIQRARLLYTTGEHWGEDSITVFPFEGGRFYGSDYDPVRVELVVPDSIAVTPTAITAQVGKPISFRDNNFTVSFWQRGEIPASVPTSYDATWNVGNYTDMFTTEGETLTAVQYSADSYYVEVGIRNDELGLANIYSSVEVSILATLSDMNFVSDQQTLDRGYRVETQLNPWPAQATIDNVRWVFDSNAFEFRDDDAGGPRQVLWVKDEAPYGDYEIVAIAQDTNGQDLDPVISDTIYVTLCTSVTGVELIPSDLRGLTIAEGETINLASYVKVLPAEACNKEFIIEIADETTLEEVEDDEGRPAVRGAGLGTTTVTIIAEDDLKERNYTKQISVTVATPLESLTFDEQEQKLHPGDEVNVSLTSDPNDASDYEVEFVYEQTVFDVERPATGGPATYRVNADAPFGDYEFVALAKDYYGNDLHISDTLLVTVCAAVTEIQVVSPIKMALGEERLLSSLITILPDEACNKEYDVRINNGGVVSLQGREANRSIRADAYGQDTLRVMSYDNQEITAEIAVTVADELASITCSSKSQSGYPGTNIDLSWTYEPANAVAPTVQWEYSNDVFVMEASPAGDPTLTIKDGAAAGEYDVVAKAYEGNTYLNISDTIHVAVWAHVTDVTVTSPLNMIEGDELDLSPYIIIVPANAHEKRYVVRSADPETVSVREVRDNQTIIPFYKATALAVGTATLKVISVDGQIEKDIVVNVAAATIALESVAAVHAEQTVEVGQNVDLSCTFTPQDATNQAMSWTTSDDKVVAVSQEVTNASWQAVAVAPGTAVLTGTSADGGHTTTIAVTVPFHVTEIQLTTTSITVNPDSIFNPDVYVQAVLPAEAENKGLVWTTSDANVVKVEGQTGSFFATALALGDATLTATSLDNREVTAALLVHVVKAEIPLTGLAFTQPAQTVWAGENVDITWTPTPADATSYEVKIEDFNQNVFEYTNSATAAPSMTVKADAAAGEYTVKAVAYNPEGEPLNVSATLTVTVKKRVTGIETTPQEGLALTVGQSVSLSNNIKVLPEDAFNKKYIVRSNNSAIASVSENADGGYKVEALAVGSTTLTVISDENTQITGTLAVTVVAAEVPLTGLAFVNPTQELWTGETVDLSWKPTPADATSYEVKIEGYDQSVFEYAQGDATVGQVMTVKADAAAGEYTVKAVAYNPDGEPLNVSATLTVTVKKHVMSLSLTEQTLSLTKGQSSVLDGYVKITPDDAHDKTVRWTSSDEAVATVANNNGAWMVTAVAGGEAELTVTSVDNPQASAKLTLTVGVPVTGITIKDEYASQTLWLGVDELSLKAEMYTIAPSDASNKKVTWSSGDESVVSVVRDATSNDSWKAVPKKVGRTTLTVTTEDGQKSATMNVEVKRHVESFSLTVNTLTLDKGATQLLDELVKEVLPSDASDKRITWRADNNATGLAVTETDGKWYVTANAVGEFTLVATSVDNPQLTQRLSVTVNAVVGGISVKTPVQSVYPGGAIDLSYTIDSNDESIKVVWSSSDANVVSVEQGNDGQWKATAKKSGSATLTVKTVPGDKTATITVTVWSHVESLSLTEQTLSLTKGQSTTLDGYVKITPDDAHDKTVRWTTSDEAVATVANTNGAWTVTAVAGGEAELTVTSVDNPQASAKLTLTVGVPVSGITIKDEYASQTLWLGVDELSLKAEMYTIAPSDASNKKVTWSSADESVVSVVRDATSNDSWKAVPKKVGRTTLTVTTEDGQKSATMNVEVKRHVESFSLTVNTLTLDKGATQLLDELVKEVLPSDASDKRITWRADNNATGLAVTETDGKWYVTANAVGEYTLVATSVDNPQLMQRLMVTVNAVVGGISVKTPVQSVYPGGAIDLSYTIDSNDESIKVVWSSSDANVVSVEQGNDGQWKATALKSGSATLTVKTVPGDKTATITVTVWSHVESLSLTEQTLSLTKGQKATLDGYVKITPDDAHDKTVRWTTSDEAVATVANANGAWTVTAVAGGEAVLKVISADNAQASAAMTVKVTVPLEGIVASKPSQTVEAGGAVDLSLTYSPSDASNKDVTWTTSDANVVTVSRQGTDGGWTAKAAAPGTAVLTAKSSDGGYTTTITVTVPYHVTKIQLTQQTITLYPGDTFNPDSYVQSVEPSEAKDKTLTWTSSDGSVVSIEGTVGSYTATVKSTGTAVLTATSNDNRNVTATLTVKSVTKVIPVTAVTLTEQTLSLTKGESTVLDGYVKITPENATNKAVTWNTSDEAVATVSSANGVWTVTAVGGGEAELTVVSADNAQASAKMTLKVTVPVSGITIKDEYVSQTLWLGVDELSLKAEMYTIAPSDASNKKVTWSSGDESVVSVVRDATSNDSWKAVPKKVGRTTLTVTTEDGQKSATMNVEVKRHVESFSLTVNTLTLDKGATQQLDELVKEVLPSDASDKRITWRADNNATGLAVTETDGKWYVTANAVGEFTLVATSVDNPQLTQRLMVTVNAVVGGISVKTPVQSVYPGGAIDLSYTIDSNDESIKVVWSSSDANVVSVEQGNDGQWKATALKSGSATLTVKTVPGDKTATITVTVWSHVESLSLTEQTLTLTKGQKATLDGYVKITPDDAHDKTVRWTTSDEAVATVAETNGAWTVTAVAGGEAVLKVVSADNAQASAAMTVKVTVPLEGIVASKPSQTVEAGGAVDLSLTYSPSDASNKDVTWTTSDANVVTVSRQGTDGGWTAKAAAPGTAVLTAKSSDGGYTTTITVTVPYHVTKIQLTQQTITLYPGDTFNPDSYVQSVEPAEAKDKTLTWTSSDGSVVSIEGTVGSYTATVKSTGTAVLTATSNDNRNVTATLTVKSVTKVIPVTAVTLTEQTLSLTKGESTVLDGYVKISPENATNKAVTWKTSDEAVATVTNANGVWTVTAVGGGEAELTVVTADNAQASAKMTLKVNVPLTGLAFSKPVQELWAGEAVDITWTPTPQDANSYKVVIEGYDQNVFEYASGNAPSMKVRANAPSGEYTVKAVAYSADGKALNVSAEMKVTVKVHVSGLSISDEYAQKPLTLLKGTSVSLDGFVTVTPSTAYDKKLTWTSSDEHIAVVTEKEGTWSVTGVSAGETTLKVTSVDNPALSAELKVTVTVAVSGITIKSEYAKQTLWLGIEPLALTKAMYTITPSDATNAAVAWSSSDESVVAVSQNATTGAWVATPKKVGSATLTVKTLEGGFTATMAVEVKAHVTSFKLTTQTLTLDKGAAATLDDYVGEVLPADASDKSISWRTADGEKGVSVAQHDGKWIVTANAVGEYTLTAYSVDNPQLTQTLKVVVSAVAGGISVTSPIQSVYPGGALDLSYTIDTDDPSSFSVTWTSSNIDVVSVTKGNDGQWTATALKSGTATLTVKTTPGDKTATIRVTVWSHVDALSLTEQTLAMTKGQSAVLDKMVTITPADAHDKTVTWTSSNPSVAAVAYADGSWSVKALAGGEAVLTVASEDNPKAVAQLAVTVTVPLEGITAVNPRQTVEVNAAVDLSLTFRPSDASRQTVTWTSSEPTVVAVSKSAEGVWTAVAKASGSALLTAKSDDGGHTATVMVTVPYHVTRILLSAQQIVRNPGAVFNPDDFVQAVEPKEVVDKSLTWTSSNPSVVKIEGKPGAYTATTLAVGTATLTAASVDNPAVKATLTVTVEAAVGGISVKNPVQSLYPGGLIDLSYTINSADAGSVAVEWTSDNSSVVEVKKSSNGTWTANALKSGKAVLTVTTTPGHKTATIAVTVWAHVDALSLTQQTLSLMKGASAALDGYVKITPADAHDKAVRWTSSDPSIASVSEAGGTWTVIAHAGGDAVLTATSVDNPKATAKMTVKVAVPLEGLAFVNPVQTVFAGELVDVAWTPTPADALSYEVKLEYDPNVFTLSTTVQHSLAVNMQAPAGDYVVKAVAYSKDGTPLGIAAELKVTVKRHVEKIEVSLAGVLTLAIGDVVTLDDYIKVLPADAADKGYTVQSANPAVVSVSKDANGLYRLAALSAGETSVEIVSTDNPSIKATISIKVAAEVIKLEGLSFNTPVQTVYAGEQIDGTWTATPANAANYIVNLEFNQDVFTILPSAQGKLQVAADAPAGDYTITARAFGLDGKELGITATLKVTIKKHVSSITLTEQTLTLKKGQTTKMDGFVKFTPEDAADRRLQWTSSDASVVALREEGGSWTASAARGGTATLTVTSLDNPEAKAVMTVVVIVPLEGVVADHPQQTVEVGSSVDLSCTFTPADATDTQIRWSSSDESIVALTETAEGGWAATAKGSGNAVLTGRTHEGGYVATITVTVPYHVTAITLTTSALALKPGDTFNPDTYVKAVVPEQAADKSLTWTTSDESVVKIEGAPGAYTATAAGVGEVTLTVRSNDRPEVTATLQITVAEEVIPLTDLAFAAPSQTVFAGEEVNVTWTPTPANANFYSVKLTYDEAVFELKSGAMTVRSSVAAGDYQIVAQAYDADGEAMAVRAVLTVTVRTHVSGIVLSDELGDEPLSVTKNETVVLDGYVTVTPADAYNQRVVWTSSNTSVATVAEKDGVWSVTGVSLGEATLTVTSADNPDVSARVSVVVVAGVIPVTGFDMADAVSMTKDSGTEVIKLTPIPADATVDVSKFSVAVSDIYGQGKEWRYLDVNVREQDGQYEAVINAAYVWGINAFDVLYDGKKMGSVSVNVGADLSFAKGWNWISTPYADYAAAGLAKVELDDMGKTFGDALQEVRSSDALLYNDPDMGYFGDFSGLTSAKMYQFHFNADPTNNLVLYNINKYDGGSASINAGWTWLAYPYEYAYTPAELAKAGVFDAAVEGDRIVAQDGFAEFSDGKWSGTLTRLQPTAGLMYFRNAEGRSAVAWKGYDALGQKLPAQDGGQAGANGRRDGRRVWDYDARAFADNMTVVAAFDGIDFPENCTVGAFVDGECRGQGQYADGRYFITVHGAAGESVSFVLYDEHSGDYWTVQGSLSFSDKAGSIKTPLRLKVGERTTAIPNLQMADSDASERTIHDLQGRRVLNPEKGVYIIQGEKKIIK